MLTQIALVVKPYSFAKKRGITGAKKGNLSGAAAKGEGLAGFCDEKFFWLDFPPFLWYDDI